MAITLIKLPTMADHPGVRRAHGHHPLRVKQVIEETADTRSFVLEVPEELQADFAYRAGQFCTFRVPVDGEELFRCYSMSSAPETDHDLTVTVKRVLGGAVSNWLIDNVAEGDVLEATRPAGVFCAPEGGSPVVAFCGGSGVTPVMSITKSVLATTDRPVRMLYANRDRDSVIFHEELVRLQADHPDRLLVRHHLDSEGGFLEPDQIREFITEAPDAEFFLCGPTPFMDLVETALHDAGVDPGRIHIERFITPGRAGAADQSVATPADDEEALATDAGGTESVTVIFKGERTTVPYQSGDTVLETARRGGIAAPFSCESGSCATCMAMVCEGSATMRTNDALTPEEVDEGWVLTCQAVPESPVIVVEYETF